jgi:hypothetical protein
VIEEYVALASIASKAEAKSHRLIKEFDNEHSLEKYDNII